MVPALLCHTPLLPQLTSWSHGRWADQKCEYLWGEQWADVNSRQSGSCSGLAQEREQEPIPKVWEEDCLQFTALGTVRNHIFEGKLYQAAESIWQKEDFLLPLPISLFYSPFSCTTFPAPFTRGACQTAELIQCTNLSENQTFSLAFCWTGELIWLTVRS